MKNIISIVLLTSAVFLLSACSEQGGNEMAMEGAKKETALDHAKKHMDSNYVCPMHPNIVKGEAGNCPICGMDLVLKEDDEEESMDEQKILYWVAPMDANYRRDEPGKSPMGMDLVPVYDEGSGVTVRISPSVENNMGVRTAVAEYNKLWRSVKTVGYVGFDENKITHIHLRTKGWIDKLLVKSEGERVAKGELLFEIYSPELVTAQEEYLQALNIGNSRLVSASKERLRALGISRKQIRLLAKKRKVRQYVQYYAPQAGIIENLNIREGMFVMPNRRIMSLVDLSSVWILAEVFERQANWIKTNQSADVRLSYLPGKIWKGKVEFIYPSLNPKTRTLKVRLRFDNADESLKPNMFAKVTIYAGPKSEIIIIPIEAVIRAGTTDRVIISKGKGRFAPREVVVGIESGDWIEIIHGLDEGDVVVTSGQFLIDSEASLKASFKRMTAMKPKQDDMAMGMSSGKNYSATSVRGIVKSVMLKQNKINISHDPIPELKWPAMTMDIDVADDINLENFKADDKILFNIEKIDNNFVITMMKKHAMGGK